MCMLLKKKGHNYCSLSINLTVNRLFSKMTATWRGWNMNIQTKQSFNSLAPGKYQWNFRHVIFKQILVIDGWGISCEIALIWMSLDFADGQSTLVQVMAWCHQATSHYLSQCWPRSLLPYGVTRPQWVKDLMGLQYSHSHGACSWHGHETLLSL